MIEVEFRITSVSGALSTKRMPLTEEVKKLRIGSLFDAEFPEENLRRECCVDKIDHISNGKDHVIVLECQSLFTFWLKEP